MVTKSSQIEPSLVEDRTAMTRMKNTREPVISKPLVTTTVKFLQNVNVQIGTDELKKDFLAKKGLTEAEISQPFRRYSSDFKSVQLKMSSNGHGFNTTLLFGGQTGRSQL